MRIKFTIYLISCFICFLGYHYGVKHEKIINEKIMAQKKEIYNLNQILNIHEDLLPVKERWHNEFKNIRHIKDILGLYNIVRFNDYNLKISPDDLKVVSIERILENGQDVGIVSIEISDKSGQGIQVRSVDVNSFLKNIYELLKNRDISVEKIKLERRDNELVATLSPFNIYLTNL
jgi:hypothetical protein